MCIAIENRPHAQGFYYPAFERHVRARRSVADRFLRKEEAPGSNPGESIAVLRGVEFSGLDTVRRLWGQFPLSEEGEGTPSERESTKDFLPGGFPLGVFRRNESITAGTEFGSEICIQITCMGLLGGDTGEYREIPASLRWVLPIFDANLGESA